MRLSRENLLAISTSTVSDVKLPDSSVFSLPEKVLQFGTGVFIRGLVDYLIDKANNQGVFNGRVLMVKSTQAGDVAAFKQQDNLFTLTMRSVESGRQMEETVVCGAISRTLNASDEWSKVLEAAANPQLEIIVSNTTEAGISLVEHDEINASPPVSFPAKLLSFLYERYKIFNGSEESGMVIVPTELIPDNATRLKNILQALAKQQALDEKFIQWLNESNEFCNSLVDRIVPGKPLPEQQAQIQHKVGYEDDLMVMSETYALWAIETVDEKARNKLTFSQVHPQVYLVPNIDKFRELKLRLLNGSHNLSCALGHIAGFSTVKEAMGNPTFNKFMIRLIQEDIAQAIVSENITLEEAQAFGVQVLDRYRNPHIAFEWLSICVEDTSKIRIRAVPVVVQSYEKYGFVPDGISLSFAAYTRFMKSEYVNGQYIGRINGDAYPITDEFAANLHAKWKNLAGLNLIKAVLGDETLWSVDLSKLEGFAENVHLCLEKLNTSGFFITVEVMLKNQSFAPKT